MGAVSSIVFGVRNTKKAVNGDVGRAPIPVVQSFNAVYDIAENGAKNGFKSISQSANKLVKYADKLGAKAGIENATSKVFKTTSKLINPLLCGAAGVRVLRDEDSKSALIEETAGLSAMFIGEGIYKTFRNVAKSAIKNNSYEEIAKDLIDCKTKFSLSGAMTKKAGSILQGASNEGVVKKTLTGIANKTRNMSDSKKKALFIAAELGFVGTSILCATLGKKLGYKITGRDGAQIKSKKEKGNTEENKMETTLATVQATNTQPTSTQTQIASTSSDTSIFSGSTSSASNTSSNGESFSQMA
ncbi:hypothetical protein IKA15_02080 [bacterium]|nr:hypothetical protein [bacterium]